MLFAFVGANYTIQSMWTVLFSFLISNQVASNENLKAYSAKIIKHLNEK